MSDSRDARETRDALNNVLRKYPPSLGRVLQLDPTLLASEEYLSAYPELASFLALHPAVVHNPTYFLAQVRGGSDEGPADPRAQSVDLFRRLMERASEFAAFLVVTGALMWLVRTLIDYRRWLRLAKVQADAHNKLLDRFGANEDLIAYMRTDAGSRFLESAPIPLDSEPRSLAAPVGRILWSLQAGIVVGTLGLGLRYVSDRVPAEVASALATLGVLATALGIGFVVSAGLSYLLSRRLGLIKEPASSPAAEPGPSA